MVFVTIDKLVSPSSSVNWNPLDDFPDHWQPRFSAEFPLPGTSGGRTGPPPLNERCLRSWLLGKTGPSSRGICCLARGTRETRCLLISGASNRRVTNGLGGPCFRWFRDRFVAQLFFGSIPVLDIFSVFAAALKIQLMSSASDLFSRWFSESNHCNLLGCQDGAGAPTDLRMRDVDYLPFAETVIFICFGLDSSRFAICRLKTPLRYSARTLSELTVFGSEKLRVNGP